MDCLSSALWIVLCIFPHAGEKNQLFNNIFWGDIFFTQCLPAGLGMFWNGLGSSFPLVLGSGEKIKGMRRIMIITIVELKLKIIHLWWTGWLFFLKFSNRWIPLCPTKLFRNECQGYRDNVCEAHFGLLYAKRCYVKNVNRVCLLSLWSQFLCRKKKEQLSNH